MESHDGSLLSLRGRLGLRMAGLRYGYGTELSKGSLGASQPIFCSFVSLRRTFVRFLLVMYSLVLALYPRIGSAVELRKMKLSAIRSTSQHLRRTLQIGSIAA